MQRLSSGVAVIFSLMCVLGTKATPNDAKRLPPDKAKQPTAEEIKAFEIKEAKRQKLMPPFEPVWVGIGMPTHADIQRQLNQQYEMPAAIGNAAMKRWPFSELTTADYMPWEEWDELHFWMAHSSTKGFTERLQYLVSKMRRLQDLGVGDMSLAPPPTMEDEARQYVLKLFVGPAMTWQIVNELTNELLLLCKAQQQAKGHYYVKHPYDIEQYKELKKVLVDMQSDLLRYKPDSSEWEIVLYLSSATALLAAGYTSGLWGKPRHRRPPKKLKKGR
jgi:hypothetical protein